MVYKLHRKFNLRIDGMGMPILYTNIKGESVIMKKALLIFGFILSMLTVSAATEDNVLQSIEIVPVKDSYNIVLVADKSVDVKKTVQAPNKVTLEMKGIRASKTLNTVYNNVSNVDTVMVEPANNGIRLFFQAENAAGTSITFDALAPAPVKSTQTQQSVKLNSPIDSYAPIYREDMVPKTTSVFDKIVNKSTGMGDDIKDGASETLNKLFSFGLVGFLAYSVIRLFRRREPDMKIGLPQSIQEREIDMFKGASPISNGYTNPEKPFTTINYGINAYKKENQNPYEQQEVTFHNPRLQQYVSPLTKQALQQQAFAARQQTAQQTVATAPIQQPVKKHTTPVNTAPVNQSNPNIDNLKFLESMTAIYEKSGRHDLAQGLKASLNKTNIK